MLEQADRVQIASSIFHSVAEAIRALQAGQPILVVDDDNRENEGDLVCAAQFITPALINFMATHARGLICLAMEGNRLDALDLPLMVARNTDHYSTAFTVSVDASARFGVSTGISAEDRAITVQTLIHPSTTARDLRRPGHIFPLRAVAGGVLKRPGHTEAAVDLAKAAGLYPAGVICEIQNPDGSMARLPELLEYAEAHRLKIISIADLTRYRLKREKLIYRDAVAQLPTQFGDFQVYGYRNLIDDSENIAIVKGNPAQFSGCSVLTRLHSECLTGDAFGSFRCDCQMQLQTALEAIQQAGQGVLVYLRQEGRGIGLLNKLKAYSLQEKGLDTIEANQQLGFKPDLRDYSIAAQILADLGIKSVKLLTNNPQKIKELQDFGINVEAQIPIVVPANPHNFKYLSTKLNKLGHSLELSLSSL
jgi:3,4-dihydroxy 2-butanone 4-phosphate synthase / GTP cyclohydrolase II